MLNISNLSVRMAGRLLIEDSSALLPERGKIGFVGRNGTGKTTLFSVITGELPSETGGVSLPNKAKIGRVAQEAPSSDETLLDIVLAADTERAELLGRLDTAPPEELGDIHARLFDIEADSAPSRAAIILKGLGFDEVQQLRTAREFSGGWRMRVALAAMLFAKPDVLLLDEPTNYLDLEGTVWLIDYLKTYPYTALIISHDRDLLNEVCDNILHLENQKLTIWKGNYDQFEALKNERAINEAKQAQKKDLRRKELQSFVDRFRAKASKAKQAQSRLKMLERLGTATETRSEYKHQFYIPNPEKKAAPPIITLEKVSTGYEAGKNILQNMTLRLDNDDRIGLLGKNGEGKSTFLKLISGRLPHTSGQMIANSGLKIAYFAQHQLDELRPEESAYEHVRRLLPKDGEAKVRAFAARFGFSGDRANTPVRSLSGGEKARLLFGLATFDGPHLLILDEPTNHLDMDSRNALVMALNDYDGAVMIVAHDKYMLSAAADRLWIAKDKTISSYEGDLDDYTAMILDKKPTNASKKEKNAKPPAPARALLAIEKDLEKKKANLERIETILSQAGYFQAHPQNAKDAVKASEKLQKDIAKLEEEWLEASV
jgi:ATP-binding cassette, subfamily F, member 3